MDPLLVGFRNFTLAAINLVSHDGSLLLKSLRKKKLRESVCHACRNTHNITKYGERQTILCLNHISLDSHVYTKLEK